MGQAARRKLLAALRLLVETPAVHETADATLLVGASRQASSCLVPLVDDWVDDTIGDPDVVVEACNSVRRWNLWHLTDV